MVILRNSAAAVILLVASSTYAALPSRLDDLVDRLARSADGLAAEAYNGFRDRDRGNRADVEALYLVHQFNAGAALFRRMIQDRRPESELRDALPILRDQVRSSGRFGFGRRAWQDMDRTLDEISRELGAGRWGREESFRQEENRTAGRMHWQGMVDDTVQIFVKGSNVNTRVVRGARLSDPRISFTSPLPRKAVTVDLQKLRGRGAVEIIQQPSRDNDFTLVIQISDNRGGRDEYEFEIVW